MIPEALKKKIRYIQIYTSKAVNDALAGEYESVFKGQGMAFDEVRAYQMGDEIRSIDWNVTARMGEPYVKRFVEERELTVLFLVDLSGSGRFGSRHRIKNEVAAELCALLAFSAIKNNDKVGLVTFTDRIEMYIPPAKGTRHVLRLIRELLQFQPKGRRTDITAAVDFVDRITKKKSVIFLVSDFIGQGFEQKLRVLGRRHDLIAVSITDPREIELPDVGLVALEDLETGAVCQIDTGNKAVRRAFAKQGHERRLALKKLFQTMDVDHVEILTDSDYVTDLIRFFRTRDRRSAVNI